MAHRGVAQEKALRLMLRPAADHRVHQDYISDHLELTGERKEEEESLLKHTVTELTFSSPHLNRLLANTSELDFKNCSMKNT